MKWAVEEIHFCYKQRSTLKQLYGFALSADGLRSPIVLTDGASDSIQLTILMKIRLIVQKAMHTNEKGSCRKGAILFITNPSSQ